MTVPGVDVQAAACRDAVGCGQGGYHHHDEISGQDEGMARE
jgi:hypothetical protein